MGRTATKNVVKPTAVDELNRKYVYMLLQRNERRGMVYEGLTNRPAAEMPYKPWQNLLLRSSIIWDGGQDPFSGKERPAGRYLIQYYDGCTTLFVDSQPQDRDTIEKFIGNTRKLLFERGQLSVMGYDKMLKYYMDWTSYNANSPYRVPTADAIFHLLDAEKDTKSKVAFMDALEDAMKLAKEASDGKMLIHAKYLGVPDSDFISGNPLSIEAIRILYREFAKENPIDFIKSYTDRTIEVKYWIEQALETGLISDSLIPNKAVWKKSAAVICDISGLKSQSSIHNKLVEFSQTEEGEEFVQQLKALYN
jgi:hypothetical protein